MRFKIFNIIKTFFKNAVVINASWLIIGRIAQMLISFVVGILSARYLGPSNYGLLNYATAYTSFFAAFCTLGINSVLVKEFIENPEEEGEIIGSSLVLKALSSLFSAVMIISIVSIIDAGEKTTIWVVAISSIGLLFQIFETINYWFQSKLRSKVTAIVSFTAYTVMALYKIVLLILEKSVIWFAFSLSLDYICIAILLLCAYFKYGGSKLKFSISTGKRILGQSYHFILASLMVAIYGYTDKFMLKQMVGASEVGYYSIAVAICGMWCFVLSAIIDSLYPGIMKAHSLDKQTFEKKNKELYAIVFYVSTIVSILICILAEIIIIVLYGEQYYGSILPLRIVTWYTAFSYLGVARNAWVVCEEKQKYLKYIYLMSAIINIVINLLFIPLWGASGAAFASLITQIATIFIAPWFIKETRRNSRLMLESICLIGIMPRKPKDV